MDRQRVKWTRDDSKDHAYAWRLTVKTASNSVNGLLHRLNKTHLLTYCSAQLTRTVNTVFSILALVSAYALCVTCSYSYSSLPGIITPWNNGNIRSREFSFPGAKVPRNFSSWEIIHVAAINSVRNMFRSSTIETHIRMMRIV